MMDGGGWRGGPGCVAVNEGYTGLGAHLASVVSGVLTVKQDQGAHSHISCKRRWNRSSLMRGKSHRACLELQPCPSTRSSRSEMET